MRRTIGTALVGLGVFLVVAAGLIRFYAYPTLATVPPSYDETTLLEAKGAQVFNTDPDVLAPQTTDLTITAHTVADDTGKVKLPEGVSVWNNNTTVRRADGTIFQQSQERIPFDSVSGVGVDCAACGSWIQSTEGPEDTVVFSGQTYKFPFNTGKHDYQNWDDTLRAATTATYEGTTSIKGMSVYKFVQTIAPRVISHEQVPGSVFGSKAPSVNAAMTYGMVRTLYIEPATGTPVQRVEVRTQELEYAGTTVPAFDGTVSYTDAQVQKEVDMLSSKVMWLAGARTWIPVLGLLLGLALLGLGLFLTRPASASRGADQDHGSDRPLVGV
ncbi:PorA family protein [Nocardioides ultimimeridianus]